MNRLVAKRKASAGRRKRVRRKVSGTAERPRLTVFKSVKHVYAQIIDDATISDAGAKTPKHKPPTKKNATIDSDRPLAYPRPTRRVGPSTVNIDERRRRRRRWKGPRSKKPRGRKASVVQRDPA
jgi:hypothetical protein